MQIIIHRINTIDKLQTIPPECGVEVDVRADGDRLILSHEPFHGGNDLGQYLQAYHHSFIIFNIKEAGIENRVIELAKQYEIDDYFLLDIEFPFIFKGAFGPGVPGLRKRMAIRYSEAEPVEQALFLKGKCDWVWIDTNTTLPLAKKVVEQLKGFKTCLVSPDRWGRPADIVPYRRQMEKLNFQLDAVMVGWEYVSEWTKPLQWANNPTLNQIFGGARRCRPPESEWFLTEASIKVSWLKLKTRYY